MPEIASIPPLTKLSEEEELFRDTVRGFAERDIRPRVAAMEKAGAIDPALLAKCFELGLMGIEIPEQHGGAGRKLWITNGAEAGLFVIFANADFSQGYKGITAFAVERGCKGFTVGKREDKLGIRASSTCELILDGVELPGASVVGEVGKGYKVAIETLNTGRIGIGAQMIGVARGALDAACKYVKERKQFGHPIGEFQAVQFQLAQAATELEAARLMVYNSARLEDAGEPYTMQAAMAKLLSSQVAERVTSLAVELFGHLGYSKEYPVEKFYRDAKIGRSEEHTSELQSPCNLVCRLLLEKKKRKERSMTPSADP